MRWGDTGWLESTFSNPAEIILQHAGRHDSPGCCSRGQHFPIWLGYGDVCARGRKRARHNLNGLKCLM